ncbi:MAG: nuclear transport factor 2 family protein [Desulfobacteraceae bacterium]|nr:MAG: nuclear transport factor 2 family protein [Desulfobacteraceae bacterium]
MTNRNIEITKRIIDAWNAHDAKKAFSFFTEDASDDDTTQPEKFSGPDCQGYWQEFFNAFPDVQFDVSRILACEDHAVIECTFMGTQKSNSRLGQMNPLRESDSRSELHLSSGSGVTKCMRSRNITIGQP